VVHVGSWVGAKARSPNNFLFQLQVGDQKGIEILLVYLCQEYNKFPAHIMNEGHYFLCYRNFLAFC